MQIIISALVQFYVSPLDDGFFPCMEYIHNYENIRTTLL